MPRLPPPGFVLLGALTLFLVFMFWVSQLDRPEDRLAVAPVPMPRVPKFLSRPGKGDAPIPTVKPSTQVDTPVMPHLGNETLKAELGRAAWKVLHTTMARFPDSPTQDESDALKSYMYLFARLYPCGECAEHFQQILEKYPPQTSSRSAAASWACFVHNQVNESKGKAIFDCSNIGDFYDCGCADDEKEQISKAGENSEVIAKMEIEVEKEGPTRGG